MKISYIPPNNKSMIQGAVEDALKNAIVNPFCSWIHETALKSIALAEWGLLLGCASGIILYICGEKKGKKISIRCLLIWIGLEIVKVAVL